MILRSVGHVSSAVRGLDARMPFGWAVLGDRQSPRGYTLLLLDPVAPSHAHLNARYLWEPEGNHSGPVWQYPREQRKASPFDPEKHRASGIAPRARGQTRAGRETPK